MLTKIKSVTLVEQVVAQLSAMIGPEGIVPGAALPSSGQLASELGVSRAVIREALKSLEARGIIAVANGKNAIALPISSAPLTDFFQRAMLAQHGAVREFVEIRKGLEIQSATLAAQRRNDDDSACLRETIAAMRRTLYDVDAFTEHDVALHVQIARATRNTMLVHLIESLRETLKDTIREGRRRRFTDADVAQVQALHEALVAAIMRGEPAAAGQAMAQHFDAIAMSVGDPLDGQKG